MSVPGRDPADALADALADLYHGRAVRCRTRTAAQQLRFRAEEHGHRVHEPVPDDERGRGWLVLPKGAQR